MEAIEIKGLSFSYPKSNKKALDNINLTVNSGEFITICGRSGCGKSTLLKHFRSSLSPHGTKEGYILVNGQEIGSFGQREQTKMIGFVQQSVDNQIVTNKVWHELAFGLESLGCKNEEIRSRVSEMASFFGIQTWFHKETTELSGGQKQILNLASIMVMQPSILILDEPTSQLDPIAASDFLETIKKINRELAVTVIITEHRLEEVLPMSDRVVVIENGKIIVDDSPVNAGKILKTEDNNMFDAMPTPMRVYASVDNCFECPITVREGRLWLEKINEERKVNNSLIDSKEELNNKEKLIEVDEIWFRYEKNMPDIVKGLSLTINKGEIFSIVGGNGTGKTTSLSIIGGLLNPYRGKISISGVDISKLSSREKSENLIGILPQNPQALFVKKTVKLDLLEILADKKIDNYSKELMIEYVSTLCDIKELLNMHPYDLSGGEQQRAALAKVLLLKPKILLLDEPTKGLDGHFKIKFAKILKELNRQGVTIVMVSHDIEFCASYSTRCAMFFDGIITSINTPREFFKGMSFYTTASNRMGRTLLPDAILAEDIIKACGGSVKEDIDDSNNGINNFFNSNFDEIKNKIDERKLKSSNSRFCFTPVRIGIFALFGLMCFLTYYLFGSKFTDWRSYLVKFLIILEAVIGLSAIFPGKDIVDDSISIQTPEDKRKVSKRTIIAILITLIVIPFTIYVGVFYLADRKYYFISMLIIFETLIPFFIIYEGKKPKAREIVVISVLCGLAVAGRAAFFMLPQFKPLVAIVIVAGVCFGGEAGFLVGAMSAFISNMMFGQGTWTPWQMFAFGIVGLIAGVLFRKGLLRKKKSSLCIFGTVTTMLVCGFILDTGSGLMWQAKPTFESLIPYYLTGLPFNIIHGLATGFFLWFIAEPMIEKLDRIKIKYGIIEL